MNMSTFNTLQSCMKNIHFKNSIQTLTYLKAQKKKTLFDSGENKTQRGKMAMEYCFQVSTVCRARVGAVQSVHPNFSKQKLSLPTGKGLKGSILAFSSSSSPFSHSFSRGCRIVCKAREVASEVQVVTDSSWKNLVIASENPVLVEFWAPWCGPCRMIAPVVDELAKEYAGKIVCYKLNTDDCPNIATEYGIRSIPTVLVFKNGEKKESVIGAVPKSTLTATIEKYVDV